MKEFVLITMCEVVSLLYSVTVLELSTDQPEGVWGMTEHYSVPELIRMHEYVSKITNPPAKRMTLLKND